MRFEEVITIQAPAEQIFSVYTEVSDWPKWDSDTVASSIDGPFEVGTTGKIKPEGQPVTPITLTEMTPNKSFTVECKLPLCKMQFVHEMSNRGNGAEVKNIVLFTGLLSPVFGFLIGSKIKKSMASSLQGLKSYVENSETVASDS